MNLFMAALNEQSYKQLKPLADRLIEIHNLRFMKRKGTLSEGVKFEPHRLIDEENRLEEQLLYSGLRIGIRKDNLLDSKYEVDAYDDLKAATLLLQPEIQPLFKELGDYLITAATLKKLLPRYIALFDSLDLDDLIATKAEFSAQIPKEAYHSALAKKRRMMEFCVEHNYSMLNMITGDA